MIGYEKQEHSENNFECEMHFEIIHALEQVNGVDAYWIPAWGCPLSQILSPIIAGVVSMRLGSILTMVMVYVGTYMLVTFRSCLEC